MDLASDDVEDAVMDSLNGYTYRWFETINKPAPYLFRQFKSDLKGRYVPANFKTKLLNQYENTKQEKRTFDDYLTELKDLESMLGEDAVSPTRRMRTLRNGMRPGLRPSMLAYEGSDYDEYVKTASRIDQALSEEADKADKKESKKETGRDTKKRQYNGSRGEYRTPPGSRHPPLVSHRLQKSNRKSAHMS